MPNTLCHIGLQGPLTRLLVHPRYMIWMVVGCVIPDLPWLYLKLLAEKEFINPYDLRLYAMAQASLLFCLLLCCGIALLARNSRTVFYVLAANSFGHLLFDIIQIKWGNGVHFFLPAFSNMVQLNLLWPEHPLTIGITLFGGVYLLFNLMQWSTFGLQLRCHSKSKLLLGGLLCATYLLAPLLCLTQLDRANVYYVHTLRNVAERAGKDIALDRVHYFADEKQLRIYTGEYLNVIGPQPEESGRVSFHGRFTSPDTIAVANYHFHRDRRDAASLLGLFMACLLLCQSLRITIQTRRKTLQGL